MLSQAAQMKKIMPAPVKNIPREQPTSTMVTLGRNKLVWYKHVIFSCYMNEYKIKKLAKLSFLLCICTIEIQALLFNLTIPGRHLQKVQWIILLMM